MFTGIIEELGTVETLEPRAGRCTLAGEVLGGSQ